MTHIQFLVPEQFYQKDPLSSELGRKILSDGLYLLYENGLEEFTFKKLATQIGTTESSVYRYFENKNQLLFYLIHYYWSWMEYQLDLAISNVSDPRLRLLNAIGQLTRSVDFDEQTPYINEHQLQEVIMLESSKTFLSKKVEDENKLGYFSQYKALVNRISQIILEINPAYPWSHALVASIIESAFHQRFFCRHLPRLSDDIGSDEQLKTFLYHLSIHSVENYHL